MADFFTADPHFGHTNIIRLCKRPFETVEQMNETLIDNWNSIVSPGDNVYLLGDVFLHMTQKEALKLRRNLNGSIHLILGNHDSIAKTIPQAFAFIKESYLFEKDEVRIYLSHYAHRCWPKSHSGAWHLYGHSHGNLPCDTNLLSFDVGVDCWNYTPVSLDQVIERIGAMKAAQERNQALVGYINDLNVLASKATRGPYFATGTVIGPRGFAVGSQSEGRPRVCTDMTKEDAAYLAEMSPEKIRFLIDRVRASLPPTSRTEAD